MYLYEIFNSIILKNDLMKIVLVGGLRKDGKNLGANYQKRKSAKSGS